MPSISTWGWWLEIYQMWHCTYPDKSTNARHIRKLDQCSSLSFWLKTITAISCHKPQGKPSLCGAWALRFIIAHAQTSPPSILIHPYTLNINQLIVLDFNKATIIRCQKYPSNCQQQLLQIKKTSISLWVLSNFKAKALQ